MIICALYTELCMKNGLWSMVVVTHCRRIYMHCMHAREWGLYNGFVPTYFLCHRALFAVLRQPHIPRLLWCCCRKYPVRSTTASKANRGIPLCLFLLTYTLQSTWWRWKKKKTAWICEFSRRRMLSGAATTSERNGRDRIGRRQRKHVHYFYYIPAAAHIIPQNWNVCGSVEPNSNHDSVSQRSRWHNTLE